jgi:hypothetical protein
MTTLQATNAKQYRSFRWLGSLEACHAFVEENFCLRRIAPVIGDAMGLRNRINWPAGFDGSKYRRADGDIASCDRRREQDSADHDLPLKD